MYGTCIDACQMNIRKSCVIDVFLCPFDSWFCRNTSSTFCLHSSSSRPWSGSQCSSISLSLFTIYVGTLPRFTQTALHWDKYRYCANFCIHQKSRSKIKERVTCILLTLHCTFNCLCCHCFTCTHYACN